MDDKADVGPAKWSGEALERAFGLGPADYIFYLMAHASRRREAILAEQLHELGLTISNWRALAVLNRLGACTMSELAHLSAVDRTTLTRTIDQLVKQGLVERTPSAGDRRLVLLRLRPEGAELARRGSAESARLNERWIKGAPDEQQITAIRALQTIVDNLIGDEQVAYGVLAYRHTHPRG
jgi:DNA-binding MarR family transcriptional regulator